MSYFVIGDIHGCFHTFSEILNHWKKEEEVLICVGDYVDRGLGNPEVINLCIKLERDFPYQTVFLKGNHDYLLQQHFLDGPNEIWLAHGGMHTLEQYARSEYSIELAIDWFNTLSLTYEQEQLFVSHAGLSETDDPLDEANPLGVIWSRSELKNLGKLQIHGHRALRSEKPVFTGESNSWNIDTGACYGFGLTGMRIDKSGEVLESIHIPTDKRDLISKWK